LAVGLRQVAQHSGVSVSTASRALSGSPRVSGQTVAKVRAAAAALGYRPNASARTLRTARSQFIGLVITNLVNTSFHTIAEVVQRELARRGYQLMLSVTAGDPVQERSALRTLVDHSAAGVIVVGSDSDATEELRELGTPTVHLARRPRQPTGDCVLVDEIAGGRSATEYLLEAGHRRIAIIAGPREVPSGRERMQGYWLAMQAAGVPVSADLALAVALAHGGQAAAGLIDDRMLALGVAGDAADVLARCRALRRLGARHLSFGPPLGPDPVVAIRLLGEAVLPALNAEEC
jgi:LacI family transcriptional regulator, galactose operon repressor